MSTMTTSYSLVDFEDEVTQRLDESLINAGHVAIAADGTQTADEDAMKAKAVSVVGDRVVSKKTERSTNSITPGELYAAVVPGAPGTDPSTVASLDAVETEVRKRLVRKLWNLTNPNQSGYIQKRLGDTSSLILCRTTVMRGLDEQKGCYVTDDATLIMEDSVAPRIESLVREAANLRKHADMVTSRHPELEQKLLTALNAGARRAAAELPKPAPKPAGELPAESGA